MQLKDSHHRIINYMRLAVTDRCNLRCYYCMPEKGIQFLPNQLLMSYEEMLRLMTVVGVMGVDKFRITGGEPFARKGIMDFLKATKKQIKPRQFSITTNATLLENYLEELPAVFDAINVSLDSLDPVRFYEITRRDEFHKVKENIDALLEMGMEVKLNAVVMQGRNIEDIIPFVEWTKDKAIEVRFIEEMPFNGTRDSNDISSWTHVEILKHIQKEFKSISDLPYQMSSTSMMYQVNGFQGKFGIIPAFSRTFCGTCNRIRVTAKGELRTCLYSNKGTDLLSPMRKACTDEELTKLIQYSVLNKEKDGFEAANNRDGFISIYESMTMIGG